MPSTSPNTIEFPTPIYNPHVVNQFTELNS